ncbi:MAG: signal peptidase I [Xanthomonadaceae bacterium]|nr:signal peptidase I [Xanthomonadaceae bacterium]
MTAAEPQTRRTRGWLTEYLPLVAMLLLLLAARDTLANHYKVPTGSMEPTLMPGDRVAVDMRAYGVRVPFTEIELRDGDAPQPGDVVVFDSPTDGTRLIKRLVAVGGQTVALTDGRLTVDGVPLRIDGEDERSERRADDGIDGRAGGPAEDSERFGTRIVRLNLDDGGGPDLVPTTIPAGMGLVLGDHRGNSADGRYFGLVPLDAFYGRAVAIYHRSGEGFGWTRL